MAYSNKQLSEALSLVEMGVSLRSAARHLRIPVSILWRRYHGSEGHRLAHDGQMYLSMEQELCLSGWVIDLNLGGMSPTHTALQICRSKPMEDTRITQVTKASLKACTD